MLTLAGTPNATVVTRLPPSVELLAAPGPSTPSHGALPEARLVGRASARRGRRRATGWSPPPRPGMTETNVPIGAAAQHEEPVAERVAHALPHAADWPTSAWAMLERLDRQIDELGNREEADGDRHQADPVPEEELAERVALRARSSGPGRSWPARARGRRPPAPGAARSPLSEATKVIPSIGQHEELGGAEGEHEGSHDRDGQPEDQARRRRRR